MKILGIGPLYNEGPKALQVIARIPPRLLDEVVVVDDASTDESSNLVRKSGVTLLAMPKRSGPGSAIRAGIDYGLKHGYDTFVVFAMNGKDDPAEIPRLLAPLQSNAADFVQGSRYLGKWTHMPFHRIWGIKLFTLLFSIFLGRRISDGTNGFRAFRSALVRDSGVNLWQEWLEGYPLETYLFVQAIRLGYRVVEVPVTKTYPASKKSYSKMKPFVDWWNYFKPVPLVCLGLRK